MEIPAEAAVQFLAVGQGFDVQVPLKGMVRPSSIGSLQLMGNGYLLHMELSVFCSHGSQSDFLIEAPPAAASGFVGVAVDYYIHVGQIRGHVPLIVNQKDVDTTNGEGEAAGQIIRSFLVVVAPDDA